MTKRIRGSKPKKTDIRNDALEKLKTTREKLDAEHGDMLKVLGEHLLSGEVDIAKMMASPPVRDEAIDKSKSLEMVHKFLNITESDFLKEQVRKSLARSLH